MKFVLLDRDNTLNYDPGYLHEPRKVKLKENTIEGLKLLKQKRFKFIVISNQSGINRGYFDKKDVIKVNKKINDLLKQHNLNIEKFYFCPHTPNQNCSCRKPKIGLFKIAEKEFDISTNKSYMIGDKKSDILFGKKINLKTVLIDTNKSNDVEADFKARDLLEAAEWIIKDAKD